MVAPRPEAQAFVERDYPGSAIAPLAGDASTRIFFRCLGNDGVSRVLMQYADPFDEPNGDILLNDVFLRAGLPVARILGRCGSAGCLIVEDLGDRMLESALHEHDPFGEPARALIERAVVLAAGVANRGTPILAASPRAEGPALDGERFRFEMDFFLEHFVGAWRRCASPPAGLRERLYELADAAATTPRRVLCHRDFHSRNLMLQPDGSLAMVDIQDARWGPDSYDLASLLHDAYIEIDPSRIEPCIDLFLDSLDDPPRPDEFRGRFRVVAAQRMLKALGTFGYQVAVKGRNRYLTAIPRTQTRLRALLPDLEPTHPLAAPLADASCL